MSLKLHYLLIIISLILIIDYESNAENNNNNYYNNNARNSSTRNKNSRSDRIVEVLEKNEIVPHILDSIPANISEIKIVYENGIELKLGNELTPKQVKDRPSQVNWKSPSNTLYTLCMTDPDVLSRRNHLFREFVHWLIVNIPGNRLNDGEVLKEYIGSAPPKATGLHRYVFFAYKQPNRLNASQVMLSSKPTNGRTKFRIKEFAGKYNLGEPVAVNFYLAKWDHYVSTFYRNLLRKI